MHNLKKYLWLEPGFKKAHILEGVQFNENVSYDELNKISLTTHDPSWGIHNKLAAVDVTQETIFGGKAKERATVISEGSSQSLRSRHGGSGHTSNKNEWH